MKGFFLVMMMIAMLIVCVLVVKNVSTHEPLTGQNGRIAALDQAKDVAKQVNKRTAEMERKLQEAAGD
jgi:competence protein ComGC